MRKRHLLTLLFLIPFSVFSQQLVKYRYWFDNNLSNALVVSSSNTTINLSIDVNSLSEGYHQLNFQSQDANGLWSSIVTSYFLKTNNGNNSNSKYRYWFDNDFGSAITINSSNTTLNLSLDINSLSVGYHQLNFQSQDANGQWSSVTSQYFLKTDFTANNINSFRYWFDEDFNNAVTKNVSADNSNNIVSLIDVSGLTDGKHQLNYQFKDTKNSWSVVVSDSITKVPIIGTISGTVINPSISDLSGEVENTLLSCTVKLFKSGTNTEVASTTATNGNFKFTGLQNQKYDVVASYISNGVTYSVKQPDVSTPISDLALKLSGALIEEINDYNDSLSNLSCYLDNLGYTVPVNSYSTSSSNTYISSQVQIANNQDKVIESLERLCMAERLLKKYYDQASTMNNEYVQSVGEFGQTVSDLLDDGSCGSGKFIDLISFIKSSIESSIDNTNSPYKNDYQIALDIVVDYLENNLSLGTTYNFFRVPIDKILTDQNLNKVYLKNTLNLLPQSVINSQNQLYSGNIQNTVSNLNLQLSNANTATAVAQAYAQSYRDQPRWVNTLTDINSIFSCFTTFNKLLDIGLNSVHIGFLASSIYQSIKRENELISEVNHSVASSYLKETKKNWRTFDKSTQTAREQGAKNSVAAFEAEYVNSLLDINNGNTSTFPSHLNKLTQLNNAVNDSVRNELNGIKAAVPFANISDSIYINSLQNSLFSSAFTRYSMVSAIAYYTQNISSAFKDSINNHAHDLVTADSLMLKELSDMNSQLANVSTPAYIEVVGADIPLEMQPNTSKNVTIKLQNFGSTPASHLYAKVEMSGLFTSSIDSIYLGDLAVNQIDSFSFILKAPTITDTTSYYAIHFFADSAITNPKGGAIISRNQVITAVGQTLVPNTNLTIYPNPTKDLINIKGKGLANDNYKLTLINDLGQVIIEKEIRLFNNSMDTQFDLQKLSSGVYFINISSRKLNESFKIQKQ